MKPDTVSITVSGITNLPVPLSINIRFEILCLCLIILSILTRSWYLILYINSNKQVSQVLYDTRIFKTKNSSHNNT